MKDKFITPFVVTGVVLLCSGNIVVIAIGLGFLALAKHLSNLIESES